MYIYIYIYTLDNWVPLSWQSRHAPCTVSMVSEVQDRRAITTQVKRRFEEEADDLYFLATKYFIII